MHPFISQKTSDQCEVLYVTLSVSINMNYFEIQGTQCVYLKMHAQYVSFISQREQFFFFFQFNSIVVFIIFLINLSSSFFPFLLNSIVVFITTCNLRFIVHY